MTGTLYGTAHFHWVRGFFFGASLGALAALTVAFLVQAADGRADGAGRRAGGDPHGGGGLGRAAGWRSRRHGLAPAAGTSHDRGG